MKILFETEGMDLILTHEDDELYITLVPNNRDTDELNFHVEDIEKFMASIKFLTDKL
jgi:hypothetical protein